MVWNCAGARFRVGRWAKQECEALSKVNSPQCRLKPQQMDVVCPVVAEVFTEGGFSAVSAPETDRGAGIWRAQFSRGNEVLLAKGLEFGPEVVVTCVLTGPSGGSATARVAFRPEGASWAALRTR